MLKKFLSLLTALCLMLTLAACGGTQDEDTAPDAPIFSAMPQPAGDMAEVYRISDTVALFAFITSGLDTAVTALACYDMATDTLLGTVNLGEGWIQLFPIEGGFAVLDYLDKTYATYDTACARQSIVNLAFDSTIGSSNKNGDLLLLTDLFTGNYHLYDWRTHTSKSVDTAVNGLSFVCRGSYQDGFVLSSYQDGLVAIAINGTKNTLAATDESVHKANDLYAAGVVGDDVVFRSLTTGECWRAAVRGEGECFIAAQGDIFLSLTQEAKGKLCYYDLSRRTVAEYAVDGRVVSAALFGTTIVAVVRTADDRPMTFVCVDAASLTATAIGA